MKRKVGLALGAGSTKGFAHIGVLQVFLENRIPIDCIAGSSIGAIIGGIYSVGSDMHMLEKLALAINLYDYLDLDNPVRSGGGFVRGDKLQELIRVLTHGKDFSQTNIPFSCVAVDLASGALKQLDSGMLHEAIRASMSIPGVFSPMRLDGHTYVDGGVIERVPCRAVKQMGADVIIGVDVGYRGGPVSVKGMNARLQYNRCMDIMQWEMTRLRSEDAHIMLTPGVQFVHGHFSTTEAKRCVDEGRRVATEALPEIQKLLKQKWIPLLKE